ncbi:hypothetical protein EV2_003991 [Malus domestica]
MGWNSLYPDSKIKNVMLEGSDHAMLFLTTEKVWLRNGRRFMYDARWSKMQDCHDLVNEDWKDRFRGSHAFRFCENIKSLRRRLKVWYIVRGRNSKQVIELLKSEIRSAYETNDFASDRRQKSNQIRGQEDQNRVWCEDKAGICSTAISYFTKLFSTSCPMYWNEPNCGIGLGCRMKITSP